MVHSLPLVLQVRQHKQQAAAIIKLPAIKLEEPAIKLPESEEAQQQAGRPQIHRVALPVHR
jgi:hypothetical protein